MTCTDKCCRGSLPAPEANEAWPSWWLIGGAWLAGIPALFAFLTWIGGY